jgi:predicted pyridoxine 5'-phosphate oxidase superfamily flavin-nucleotide-binding protein
VEIDDELAAFLECAGSLIVGTVGADGVPTASRAWDLRVLGDHARIRVQLDAADAVGIANVDAGRSVAVTVTDVFTLRSVQVKGSGAPTDAPTGDDIVHGDRYRAGFLANVVEVEQVPEELALQLLPPSFLVFEMPIDEVYDQTPGPGAGARLGAAP